MGVHLSTGLLPVQYENLFDQMGAWVMTTYMQKELSKNYTTTVDQDDDNSCASIKWRIGMWCKVHAHDGAAAMNNIVKKVSPNIKNSN